MQPRISGRPLELAALVDLRRPGARYLLRALCSAFGRRATVEELGQGAAVLVIRLGRASEARR